MDKYNFEDSEEMIRIVNENNRRLREKNSKVDVRTNKVRRDSKKRNKLRIRNMICSATLITAMGFTGGLVANAGINHLQVMMLQNICLVKLILCVLKLKEEF